MVFIFQVTKLQRGVLKVQVLLHEVRLVKMWKICIKSVKRSAYIWWCSQHSWCIIQYMRTYEPKIRGRLPQNLCPSGERWPETKPTRVVQGPTRTGQEGKRLPFQVQSKRWKLGLWLWPRNKATVIPMEESFSCHPRELRQLKSDFQSMLSLLEQWGNSSEGVFSSLPPCESTVLHRSAKGFYGSCWEKMPNKWCTQDWLLHCDNMPCHMDSWLFPVPNQKNMVVVSGLCTSQSCSSWLILVLKDRNMIKGMKIKGYHENKAESQEALERNAKYEFQRCF